MPWVNAAGDVIPEMKRSPKVEVMLRVFSWLKWPRDRKKIMRLGPKLRREWLFSLSPRDALLITCSRKWKRRIEREFRRGVLGEISNWFWRYWNGFNF